VQATDFDGSDNEVYQQSFEEDDDDLRDDLSLSDQEPPEDYEDEFGDESNEEERERQFFGDEDYTLLSKAPEEEIMSQTMQNRELKERRLKLDNLIHDMEQIEARIRARKQEGQIISGNKIDFEKLIDKYKQIADRVENDEDE
jgi:hypothetical protein